MARTEIKLDDVYYKINRLPTQTLANQMASKVGQGQSEYGDLTTWSAWIQEDWQDGVGRIKPHRNGGFLYGEAESRVPGQMILPQEISLAEEQYSSGFSYNPGPYDGSISIIGSGLRGAAKVQTPSAGTILASSKFWIYCNVPTGVELTFALYSDLPGLPNTQISTATYTPPEDNTGFYWHGVALDTSSLSLSSTYWLVMYPTNGTSAITWKTASDPATNFSVGAVYNGSSWSLISSTLRPSVMTSLNNLASTSTNAGAGIFRFNGKLYAYSNNRVWSWFADDDEWVDEGAITNITAVTSAINFGSNVYFGNEGGDGDYAVMNTSEVITDAGADGHIFAKFRGYLWRANANYVEYTSDGSTWEPTATLGEPIYVSDTSDPITGLCGLNDKMYAMTTAGIVPIYAGDIVFGIHTWGSLDPQNGMSPVEFEGAIYVIVGGRVIRYTEDGTTQDVWMTRDNDLLTGRIGRVWDLVRTNNWLVALVGGADADDKPSIWAFQKSSWHHIATLPNSTSTTSGLAIDYGLYYDRATSRLWAITPDFVTYYWYIPDYSINPYNDPNSRYMATAWVEWDWFDSQVLEAPKDFDSVTIMGENFSSTRYVDVYWQDDASTAWEYLGRVDSNHEELRWSIDGGTRPNSRRLKLGFLIATEDSTETPRIRAFRVKYHLMVRDWFRWNLQIDVSGRSGAYQMLADGTRNTLTAAQIKAAIDTLVTQIPPFVYQDVDGTTYEVKVLDGNFQYTKYEYNEATTNEWWEGVYSLVIEQVTQGTYTAP